MASPPFAQRCQTDEAMRLFEQAISANPDVPNPYYGLGVALHRVSKMPVKKIREIAYEIGMDGRNGLDHVTPDKKYPLKSLPDGQSSGLHLMCLMFAGFKCMAPEHDFHMDLNEPFLPALEMFENGESVQ